MITLKDLKQRVYSGKTCTGFEYDIVFGEDSKLVARFIKQEGKTAQPNEWRTQIIADRTRDKDSEVYNFRYIMPKNNLPLELIAATGLRYFQLYLKKEIQEKSNLDFIVGEIVRDM